MTHEMKMNKLLSVASGAISANLPKSSPIFGGAASPLEDLLTEMNGFYVFESAFHVFPSGRPGLPGRSLEEWNSKSPWQESYGHLIPEVIFFAEDVFGGQFPRRCRLPLQSRDGCPFRILQGRRELAGRRHCGLELCHWIPSGT